MTHVDVTLEVVYKDNFFVKLKPVNADWGDWTQTVSIDQIADKIDVGDIVTDLFGDKQYKYKLVSKNSEKHVSQSLDNLYMVENIDENFISLLKNDSKKSIKIQNNYYDFKEGDFVHFDTESQLIEKDDILMKYILRFIRDGYIYDIKYFSIKKMVANYCHNHCIALFNINNFDDVEYVADYKLPQNTNLGDCFYNIILNRQREYYFDEENYDDITNAYAKLLKRYDLPKHAENVDVQLSQLKTILLRQENALKKMEQVNLEEKKYYENYKLPYNESDIEGVYELEERETNDSGVYFRAVKEESEGDIYINIKEDDLPLFPKIEDEVVAVKNNGQIKYYYTRGNFYSYLEEKISKTKEMIKALEVGYEEN